ncbi:SLC13 family permease [Bacillus daqingensis]|uniref:Sodium-dependent dicarboxylate transporter SdcS n=1 Tax=Bacillus daqingensis TaxID=872396 RepID=A0ABV9NX72_9BACI
MKQLVSICLALTSIAIVYFIETTYMTYNMLPLTTSAIFLFGLSFWLLNYMPAPITGIFIMILFALFGVLSFEEVVAGLGHPVIWLVISVLFLGAAVEHVSLDKRLAFYILSKFGRTESKTLSTFIGIGFLFTFLIPNAMARLSLLMPIATGIIKEKQHSDANFNKSIILIVTLVPYITTVTVITGASGSIYAAGLFETTLDYSWSYLFWLILIGPISIATLVFMGVLIRFLFPVYHDTSFTRESFTHKLEAIGPVTAAEKKLLGIYALLILGWITNQWHPLSISMLSVIALVVLFLPGMNIVKWSQTSKDINWGVPILFAAGLAIAAALEAGGVIDVLDQFVLIHLETITPIALAAIIMVLIVVIRIGFTNFNSMVASTMPIILVLGIASDANPIWLGMLYLIASSTSFLIPTQSIGSITTYALGYYSTRDYARIGGGITIFIIVVSLAAAIWYWPLAGLPIYD